MLDLLATDIPGQTPSKPVHMLQAWTDLQMWLPGLIVPWVPTKNVSDRAESHAHGAGKVAQR